MSEKKQEEYKIANDNKMLKNLIRLKNSSEEKNRVSSKLGTKFNRIRKLLK